MVKNKALPDSARLGCTPNLVTLSLSLPRRLGPIKSGLTCLLSPMPFILRVPPGSCGGWTPARCQTISYMTDSIHQPHIIYTLVTLSSGFPHGTSGKEHPCQWRRCKRYRFYSWMGKDNPLQYSCLEKRMDREAWQAAVHGVAQSWTRLKHRTL